MKRKPAASSSKISGNIRKAKKASAKTWLAASAKLAKAAAQPMAIRRRNVGWPASSQYG
jgi:hypothetical protein